MSQERNIAILKLSDFLINGPDSRQRFVKDMGESLKEFGFFAIGEHGVEQKLIEQNYAHMRQFFDLDSETKNKYEIPGFMGQRGFTSFGKEHAKDSDQPDLKEFWHVGREVPEGHDLHEIYRPNIWIDEVPAYKNSALNLMDQLDQLAIHLLRALALYLGEEETYFDYLVVDGNSILRTIHYPEIPEDAHPAAIRAAAHEDINLITILCESTAPGLELLRHDGTWMQVHGQSGYLVVDSGDMLARITNEVIPLLLTEL